MTVPFISSKQFVNDVYLYFATKNPVAKITRKPDWDV